MKHILMGRDVVKHLHSWSSVREGNRFISCPNEGGAGLNSCE